MLRLCPLRRLAAPVVPARARAARAPTVLTAPAVLRVSAVLLVSTVVPVAGARAATARSDGPVTPTAIEVAGSTYGRPLPPSFVGLSIEYPALADYLGRNASAINPVFVSLLRALTPGSHPILRIGGDSTDATWWPLPGAVPTGGISYVLSRRWLAVVHALAMRTGARLILGINLAANRPQVAATEARTLIAGVGRRFVGALEIGNEPDLYNTFPWYASRLRGRIWSRHGGYGPAQYVLDARRWARAMPPLPLAGPALANLGWFRQLPTLTQIPHLRIFTSHRYPLVACERNPNATDYASIGNLLADSASAGLAASIAPYVPIVHADGLQYRVDELNSAACEGRPGVSNSFASALWILDTLFNMAAVGVDGVNIHTLPGAAYAPFSFTDTAGRWAAQVNPIYYGMLMFVQAFPPGATLLNLQAPAGPLKAWATIDPAGRIRVVLINQDPAGPATVDLTLPANTGPLSEEALLDAGGLAATDGVTLGGQTFDPRTTTGTLPPPITTPVLPTPSGYPVTVPAGSAVLLSGG